MNENKKWYAVYTRPFCEKKVRETLNYRQVENYCPANKVVHQWFGRKKIVQEPLFKSYVFARISERELVSLKQTDGVISLVYRLDKPAIICDSEIEMIKRFLNEHYNVKLEKTPLSGNGRIRKPGGTFTGQEDQVQSVRKRSVEMLLPSLGYLMFAEVETANAEVILKTRRSLSEVSEFLYAAT